MEYIIGINYEGGKIIKHIKKYTNCIAYANLQIAMDAPYHSPPRIADEKIRSTGRSESQFNDYDEEKLKNKFEEILRFIKEKYKNIKLVIQIARGRSAEPTFTEIIKPILDKINIINYEYKFGYKSKDYYFPSNNDEFVFLNYGMFAELSESIKIEVGEICNPNISYDILDNITKYTGKAIFIKDKKNILNYFKDIKKLKLFGIADDMKFITPDVYKKSDIINLINMSV